MTNFVILFLSSVVICSSFFDEFTDGPKMTGFSLAANGWPGRARRRHLCFG